MQHLSRPGTPAAAGPFQTADRPATPSDAVRPVTPSELPVTRPNTAGDIPRPGSTEANDFRGQSENTQSQATRRQTVAEVLQFDGYEGFQSNTDKFNTGDIKGSSSAPLFRCDRLDVAITCTFPSLAVLEVSKDAQSCSLVCMKQNSGS